MQSVKNSTSKAGWLVWARSAGGSVTNKADIGCRKQNRLKSEGSLVGLELTKLLIALLCFHSIEINGGGELLR